jgi:hypothetical protein
MDNGWGMQHAMNLLHFLVWWIVLKALLVFVSTLPLFCTTIIGT